MKKKLNQVGQSLSEVVDSLGTNLAPSPAILEKPVLVPKIAEFTQPEPKLAIALPIVEAKPVAEFTTE